MPLQTGPWNIRVNTLSPVPIRTPLFGKSGLSQEQIDGFIESINTRVPHGRIGNPEEVAVAAFYLAADATFMTGGEIVVGGGLTYV